MATELRLPRVSEEMQEGTVSRWLKQEGDAVAKGEPLVEVETEKVIVEVEATTGGVLLQIVAHEQQVVPVDGVLCLIGKASEMPKAAKPTGKKQSPQGSNVVPLVPVSSPSASQPDSPSTLPAQAAQGEAVPQAVITPLARRVALELGIDLGRIKGSGIGGKIIMFDLQPFMASGPNSTAGGSQAVASAEEALRAPAVQSFPSPSTSPPPEAATFQDLPHSAMRGTVARRMAESKAHIPHFYMTVEIDMAACLAWRDQLNKNFAEGRISLNDVFLKAAAKALMRVPELNAEFRDGAVRRYGEAHIGFAVALDEGLVTPVLRNIQAKGIAAIARESAALIERAKTRALKAGEMQGGTFTISNLGMHDIVEFSAIINPPQVGILAIARPVERAVVKNGWVVASPRLNATLSADHRAVDGVGGAAFLAAFKEGLEDPETLLL